MANVDFKTEAVTVTKQTINDDELRLTIDWPIKAIFIGASITRHLSDGTEESVPVQLTLNESDFGDALLVLFPPELKGSALDSCKSGIIQLCKQHKNKLQ